MQIKKTIALLAMLIVAVGARGQLIGLGGQYAQKSDGQFFISAALPTYQPTGSLHLFNLSGVEYTTYGGAALSGLQIKPIQLSSYLSNKLFYDSRFVLTLGVDAGYLFNFGKGRKNTVVVTPNLYFDYKIFFLKTGYELDTLHGNHQFFVRVGVGFALGTLKNFR